MQDQSSGGDFMSAFRALTYGDETLTTLKQNRLPAPKPVPEIPARTGESAPISTPTSSGTGSIAGPLTEALYSQRTFWASRSSTTPDGLFTLAWMPLKSIRLLDANGAEVVMNFKDAP